MLPLTPSAIAGVFIQNSKTLLNIRAIRCGLRTQPQFVEFLLLLI